MSARYRPSCESAAKAPMRGSTCTVPPHAFKLAAAVAVDMPSDPVRYIIKLADAPTNPIRSKNPSAAGQ